MPSVTIRLAEETHTELQHMAEANQTTIGKAIADLIAEHKREQFWREAERSVSAAMANPEFRQQMDVEQREFDGTLMDGLERETWPGE